VNEVLIREKLAEARSRRTMVYVGLCLCILMLFIWESLVKVPAMLKFQGGILWTLIIIVGCILFGHYNRIVRKYQKELEKLIKRPFKEFK
jgi:hypothetical protein